VNFQNEKGDFMQRPTAPQSREEIIEILDYADINHRSWAKPMDLDSLVRFTQTGEMKLERTNGDALLHVYTAVVTVRNITGKGVRELYEAYLIEDGCRRTRPFNGSLGEKIRWLYGEDDLSAGRRGINEELGETEPEIKTAKLDIERLRVEDDRRPESDYYGKLPAVYHRHHVRCLLPYDLCRKEFIAHDDGREFHFLWKTVITN
jgi:hypothetical protein